MKVIKPVGMDLFVRLEGRGLVCGGLLWGTEVAIEALRGVLTNFGRASGLADRRRRPWSAMLQRFVSIRV